MPSISDSIPSLDNMSKEEILLQLLRKEHNYYLEILNITHEEQSRLRPPPSVAELKPLLSKKKVLLSCINEIEGALTPLKKYWHTKTDKSDVESGFIKQELEALNKLLREILQIDLMSQKALETHMVSLRQSPKG